jgi:hypothetical protein
MILHDHHFDVPEAIRLAQCKEPKFGTELAETVSNIVVGGSACGEVAPTLTMRMQFMSAVGKLKMCSSDPPSNMTE